MEPVIYRGECYVVDTNDITVVDGKTFSVYYAGVELPRKCFRLPGGGLKLMVAGVNYLVRPATTILAGGGGGIC
jgi:hypothetical protein